VKETLFFQRNLSCGFIYNPTLFTFFSKHHIFRF